MIAGLLEHYGPEEAAGYLAEISQTSLGQGEQLRARIAPPWIAALLVAKVTIAAESGVQVIIDDTSHLDEPSVDPQVLITIIGNLINNAVDAVTGQPPPRRVNVHISDDDGHVYISVTDTGPGIARRGQGNLRGRLLHQNPARRDAARPWARWYTGSYIGPAAPSPYAQGQAAPGLRSGYPFPTQLRRCRP